MKRRDLLKALSEIAKTAGVEMEITEGGNHTKVKIGDKSTVVARHNEINELTAKSILKHMGGER